MANYTKMSDRVSGPGVKRKSPRNGKNVTKAPKGVAGMGKLMQQGMSATAAKNLLKTIRENKPTGRISQLDIRKAKDMMEKKPKTLGPLRNIRERAKQSRLVGGKSTMNKPKR